MEKEMKQRLKSWLDCCLTFDIFKENYEKMLSVLKPSQIEKFNNLEKFKEVEFKDYRNYYKVLSTDTYWYAYWVLKVEKEVCPPREFLESKQCELSIMKCDFNNLPKKLPEMIDKDKPTHDSGAVNLYIDIYDNGDTCFKYCKVIPMKKDNKYYLVCREISSGEIIRKEIKELTEQQVNALLGKTDIKQL